MKAELLDILPEVTDREQAEEFSDQLENLLVEVGGVFPCQIGVMAAWATGAGQALVGREIYLHREWADDRARCRAAHVPGTVVFATKPRLAEQMIARIVPDLPGNGVWVAADEVHGRDGAFRAFLEENHLPYAVNVQANHTVLPRPGRRHAARLVERHAARGRLGHPAGQPLPARLPRLAVVGTPYPRPRGGDRRGCVGAVVHRPAATEDAHSA
jgi:hypothetical protein